MATINIRIDDELKARSFAALQALGVSPSELLRHTLQYVADHGRLPFKPTLLSDDDLELLKLVRERLQAPEPVRVTLDEL